MHKDTRIQTCRRGGIKRCGLVILGPMSGRWSAGEVAAPAANYPKPARRTIPILNRIGRAVGRCFAPAGGYHG